MEYQPYFLAYMAATGATPATPLYEYMAWIGARWRDYRKSIGVGTDAHLSDEDRGRFLGWLNEAVGTSPR